MKSKIIYLLIGQKGSGKSFIGTLLEKELGIKFIRVEDWAKKIKKNRNVDNEAYLKQVFEEIESGIRDSLTDKDKIVFESTGLTEYFDLMLESLRRDFQVTTIGVYADRTTCLERVKSRDQEIHINISDDQVLMINEKVRERNFETDFSIINEDKSEKELINEISKNIEQTIDK
ncbi:MAG: AAA family ATPase [Candidatus Kapabacteria bacterium]|nr:AAA family ATPase [Ignavibacteriota bacterium]MCW5884059.1 AAA family ATPase [Candidatus Kapabacteria bacterium]